MRKTGRNDPCPCGSGRKFKKCCINRQTAKPVATSPEQIQREVADLDSLSNSVLDLIQDRRFEEAEKTCHRLMAEYPDQVDGLDRLAMTYAAQGRKADAANCYRKAVNLMRSQVDFDEEVINDFVREAGRLETESGRRE